MAKITTFDDWTDYFRQWQKDIGLDTKKFDDYKFEVKFGAVPGDAIEFGDYAGRPKWETVLQIPDQRVRVRRYTIPMLLQSTEKKRSRSSRTQLTKKPRAERPLAGCGPNEPALVQPAPVCTGRADK